MAKDGAVAGDLERDGLRALLSERVRPGEAVFDGQVLGVDSSPETVTLADLVVPPAVPALLSYVGPRPRDARRPRH